MIDRQFKIEHDVPIPLGAKLSGLTATLKKMKVGDSFIADFRLRSNVPTTARRLGMKVATRTIDSNHMRVWRVQ